MTDGDNGRSRRSPCLRYGMARKLHDIFGALLRMELDKHKRLRRARRKRQMQALLQPVEIAR